MLITTNVNNYLGSCDAFGDWEQVQCNDQFGICWCVNTKTGEIIQSTITTKGTPNCKTLMARSKNEEIQNNITYAWNSITCNQSSFPHSCNPKLCDVFQCVSNKTAECRINQCKTPISTSNQSPNEEGFLGQCGAQFFLGNQKLYSCKIGVSKCVADQKDYDEALNLYSNIKFRSPSFIKRLDEIIGIKPLLPKAIPWRFIYLSNNI